MERFTGEADEDVDEFVEAMRISFIPYEGYYGDEQTQAKARLLYLSSRLEGKAKKWWRTVGRGDRDTWEKAANKLRA